MQNRPQGDEPPVSDGSGRAVERSFGESELSWEIACSLLEAESYTNRALEEHVFRMFRKDADHRSTEEYLEEALDRHREIVKELEYALDSVDE